MDDFIIGYIEGGLEYDHNYDHDLHRDLELELGNNHDDGPFAALADEVDLLPHYDHDDYHIEYYARSDQGGGFAGVNLDERSVDPEGSGGLQYRHRYESSVSESIGSPSSSDSGSEDVHQHHYHISDDDSEEEEEEEEEEEQVRGHYGIPFPGRRHSADDESEESDYGSLPSFDVDQVHDYSENEQAEDSSPDEGDYQNSEDDEVHPPSVQWDPLAEVAALSDDEILADLEAIHEIDVFSEDQDSDDSSDDEALVRHYDVELSSSSEEQRSNNQYDDNDDDEDQASAANSRRSTSSTSPSEGSIALPSHHQAFLAHHPRGFDAIRDLDNLQRERQRLQEDLRQLRDAHFGIPHSVRRANVPNGVDYLLDRLPAPQRDAHGLIAQMEMDLERGRQQRRRAAPSPIRAPPRTQQQQQQPQQREPAFIDLTGDSESPPPEVLALPDAPRFAGRDANPFTPRDQTRSNPRRNNPVRRAPSFARSDGSFLGPGGAPIIDLTNDAPEADLPARLGTPRSRREVQNNDGLVDRVRANAWGAANMNAIFRQMGIPRVGADFLQHMRVALGGGQVDYEVEFIGENIRPDHNHMNGPLANFPIMENPLADNPVDFNYGANGLNQEAARPKPAHIAPPEPREGFTRSTGEDTVVICPSCEEELKYDPDEKSAQPPPAKKVRTTKKDREEHHFWAVKACGHVYCRSCFENRRPTTRNAGMAHFQVVDKRILCAVDECSSDVSTKTAWVGIFL